MEWSCVPNMTAVKVRKRRASRQRKIISMTVTGGEKSLHSAKGEKIKDGIRGRIRGKNREEEMEERMDRV